MAQRAAAKKGTVKTSGVGKTTTAKKKDAPSPVYFLLLKLSSVRCFGPFQELHLSGDNGRPARWTVILGENGVGKTTLLQALAGFQSLKAVKTKESHHLAPRFGELFGRHATNFYRNAREGNDAFPAKLEVSYFLGDLSEIQDGRRDDSEVVKLFVAPFSHGTQFIDYDEEAPFLHQADNIDEFEALKRFTCYGYGAGRRSGKANLASQVEDSTACDSLFSANISLPDAEEWLLQADYLASKPSLSQDKFIFRRDEIKKILIQILPDVEDIKVTVSDEKNSQVEVLFKTHYGWVPIWNLSHGYQTLIAWVVDFARRMFERYPESKNPLAEPAVVLVDEIDLHLHPKWQQSLMSFLTERFPNTQFIVTAHSPLIVQGAKDVNVVLLRREGDHVVIENHGSKSILNWRVDQILTSDLFGLESVRPPYVEEKLVERRKLLSKGKLTKKDRERIEELEAEIGPLPTGDTPQEIKAMDIINRAAKLLSERSGTK